MAALPENDRLTGPLIAGAGQIVFDADFPLIDAPGDPVGTCVFFLRERDGARVEMTLGDFIVQNWSETGFELVLAVPALAGDRCWIIGRQAQKRARSHPGGGAIYTAMLEGDAREAAAKSQEMAREQARAISAPVGEGGFVLPPETARAGRVLAFDEDGKPMLAAPSIGTVEGAEAAAVAAVAARDVTVAARDEATGARDGAETARTGAEAAETGATGARDDAQTARTGAEAAHGAAAGEADRAETAAEEAAAVANGMLFQAGGALIDGEQPLAVMGAKDLEEIFRVFLAFMPDMSIRSAAINALVTAQMGGYRFALGRILGYRFAIIQEDPEDGRWYILAGLREDGSWYPASTSTGGRTCYHLLHDGQSNAPAEGSIPVITTAPTGWGSKMFQRGVRTKIVGEHDADPENRPDVDFAVVDLVESGVETRGAGLADTLKMLIVGGSRYTAPVAGGDFVLISNSGTGGRRLSEVGPRNTLGEGQWLALLDDARRAYEWCQAEGHIYVPILVVDQGEKEGSPMKLTEAGSELSPSALIEGYTEIAVEMAIAFDTAMRDLTGDPTPFPMFVTPASYNTLTPEGWARASAQCPLIRIVGGRGTFQSALHGNRSNTDQAIHYSPDSHRSDLAERCARAIWTEVVMAEAHEPPVAYRARKLSATSIQIYFDSRYPLAADFTTMPPALDMGVTLNGGTLDSPGTAVRATALDDANDGRSLIATVPSVPAGALLTIGKNSKTALVVPNSASVAAASADPIDATARYTVAVADADATFFDALKPLIDLGHFFLYGTGPATSQGVIRWVEHSGGQTLMTGRVAERRTGGSYAAFETGQTLEVGHTAPYANIRNRSPARARSPYQQGVRAGRYPDLHDWTINRTGIPVEGA